MLQLHHFRLHFFPAGQRINGIAQVRLYYVIWFHLILASFFPCYQHHFQIWNHNWTNCNSVVLRWSTIATGQKINLIPLIAVKFAMFNLYAIVIHYENLQTIAYEERWRILLANNSKLKEFNCTISFIIHSHYIPLAMTAFCLIRLRFCALATVNVTFFDWCTNNYDAFNERNTLLFLASIWTDLRVWTICVPWTHSFLHFKEKKKTK